MPLLEQASRITLNAKHEAVRRDLRVHPDAARRAATLLDITAGDLLDIVCTRQSVVLAYWDRLYTYHLFYNASRDAFYILMVGCERESFVEGAPHIQEVLTVEEFEADQGEVSPNFMRRAASQVLDAVEFRTWDERVFGKTAKRKGLRVITYFDTGDGKVQHRLFRGPPVCQAYIDNYGLENAFGHVGFAPWFKRQIAKAEINLDHVVALAIADTGKQVLRVDAPMRDCPACALAPRALPTQYAAAETDDAKPVARTPIARLRYLWAFLARRRTGRTGAGSAG